MTTTEMVSRAVVYDYNRLSGVTHCRPSATSVLQPLNLLCEAFAGRNPDSPLGTVGEARTVNGMTLEEGVIRKRKG